MEGLSGHFIEATKGPRDPRSEGGNAIKGAGMPLAPLSWKRTCKDVNTTVLLPLRTSQEGWHNNSTDCLTKAGRPRCSSISLKTPTVQSSSRVMVKSSLAREINTGRHNTQGCCFALTCGCEEQNQKASTARAVHSFVAKNSSTTRNISLPFPPMLV